MNPFDRLALLITPGVYSFTPQTYDDAFADRIGAGHLLSTREAEGIPIVYICTHVVSEDVAKVSLHIFEDLGTDDEGRSLGKRKATDHPWYDALRHQANEYQSAIDFREMMTAFALNRGRGVAKKRTRRVGGVVRRELYPLHPDCIHRETTASGDERWRYQNPATGKEEILLPDELLILWGPRRRSVISFLRELLANMNAGQTLAGQIRTRGPRHTGVIARPKDAPKWNDKARENFRKAIDEYMGEGERAGRPLLLEDGMTWLNSGFSLADSEFIAGATLDNALVCGAYRVPQHKAGLLERSTNNNIAQQAVDYVVDCLLAWAVRWEQALDISLLDDPFLALHNLRTLLRGDPKTAAEAAAIAGSLGWMVGNEWREDEGRNPIDGLWEPRVPLNMADVPGTSVAADHPLRRVSSNPLVQALLTGGKTPAASTAITSEHHRSLVWDAASRIVRKEARELGKRREQVSPEVFEGEVRSFYQEHVAFVAKVLRIDDRAAAAYCELRCRTVLADPSSVDGLVASVIGDLVALALDERPEEPPPMTQQQPFAVHVHQAPISVESPPVTFAAGAIQVDSPVTIEKGAVQVSADAPPVTVEPAVVTVNVPPQKAVAKTVQRDRNGRVTGIIEEPV